MVFQVASFFPLRLPTRRLRPPWCVELYRGTLTCVIRVVSTVAGRLSLVYTVVENVII